MSAPEDEVSVSVDGVSVRKMVNDHEFETLAVVLDVTSERDERVIVTVSEEVPEGVDQDDIGFHPEYGGEYWQAEPDEVVFTRTFTHDDAYTTVYGIRGYDGDREALLEPPTVEVELEDEPDIDDLVSEEDSDAVKGVIAGEADSLPGMGEEAPTAESEETEPAVGAVAGQAADEPAPAAVEDEPADALGEEPAADLSEEEPAPVGVGDGPDLGAVADEPDVGGSADEGADVDAAEATVELGGADDQEVTVPVTGGIARVLAKELRAGNVSTEDRRLLRDELLPDDGSTDARIRRLQTQVADLDAYTDALEVFLDEEGGAQAVVDEFRDDLDAFSRDLEDYGESLADVEAEVDDLGTAIDASDERIEELDRDLDGVVADVDEAGGRIEDLETDLETVQADIEALEELLGRVEGVEDDVADIRDELADLAAFRERLSSVFGPGGVGGEGVGSSEDVIDGPDEDEE